MEFGVKPLTAKTMNKQYLEHV